MLCIAVLLHMQESCSEHMLQQHGLKACHSHHRLLPPTCLVQGDRGAVVELVQGCRECQQKHKQHAPLRSAFIRGHCCMHRPVLSSAPAVQLFLRQYRDVDKASSSTSSMHGGNTAFHTTSAHGHCCMHRPVLSSAMVVQWLSWSSDAALLTRMPLRVMAAMAHT
jgi:hypothetical protein